MNGIIVINKQKGDTSFKAVSAAKRIFGEKKAGHCGTLDPLATGVLPVMIGNAVKCSEYLTDHDKKYRAKVMFGYTSDTEDVTGTLVKSDNYFIPSLEDINSVLPYFTGKIKQTPPMYSAVKVNGKKLYELARSGIEIERKEREITVYSISACCENGIYLEITCSKGTYIRTLCSEIGKKLGCGAVMEELCRTSVGKYENGNYNEYFSLKDSISIDSLSSLAKEEQNRYIIPVEKVYDGLEIVYLPEFYERLFRNGVEIYAEKICRTSFENGKLYRIYGSDGFFAVGMAGEYKNGSAVKVKNFF